MVSDLSEYAEHVHGGRHVLPAGVEEVPAEASCGALPMEWTTPSRRSVCSRTRPASESR